MGPGGDDTEQVMGDTPMTPASGRVAVSALVI